MKRMFAMVGVAVLTCGGAGCSTTPTTKTTTPTTPSNFGFVTADIWRGGRPSKAEFASLAQMGVRTVINLEETDERESLAAGVAYKPLAVSGWRVTGMDTAAIVEAIRSSDKPVFIHCREGRDRTGLAVAAYRLSTGMSSDDAIAELNKFHVNLWWRLPIENRIRALAKREGEAPPEPSTVGSLK